MNYRDYAHFQTDMDAMIAQMEKETVADPDDAKVLEWRAKIAAAVEAWKADVLEFLGLLGEEHLGEIEEPLERQFCRMCGKHTDTTDRTVCYAGGDHWAFCDRLYDYTDGGSGNSGPCDEGKPCDVCKKVLE